MNPWKRFSGLSYRAEFRIGTVVSTSGNESTLEDAAGNQFVAFGTSVSIGLKAYVRDDIIQGEAPTLTESTVYV
jgi:hypothetical protein